MATTTSIAELSTTLFVPRLIGSSIGIWSRKSLARLDDGHLGNTGVMSLLLFSNINALSVGSV